MTAPKLGARQLQILELVGEGLTNRQAADRLGITEGTVRNLLYRASKRLGAHYRTHAVALAFEAGVLR